MGFYVPLENFSLMETSITISGEGLQILTYARHSWPLSSQCSLASNTYCDTGHPFIMVISEDPWHSRDPTLTTPCRTFSSGAVTTCFYDLRLSQCCYLLLFATRTFRNLINVSCYCVYFNISWVEAHVTETYVTKNPIYCLLDKTKLPYCFQKQTARHSCCYYVVNLINWLEERGKLSCLCTHTLWRRFLQIRMYCFRWLHSYMFCK